MRSISMLFQFLGRRVLCALCAAAVAVFFMIGNVQGASAGFKVGEDAFHISNAPGYCFAMAAFAGWYYANRPEDLPLRKVLSKKVQTQIARQLQEYYARNLVSLQAEYCNRSQENHDESFKRFAAGLTVGEPRIVLLMNREKSRAVLHAVLAYEWVPEQHLLKVYDPNYSLQERFIDLEKGRYTSLDITYHAICFPEVLQHNAGLVRKMESLCATYAGKETPALVSWRRAAAGFQDQPLKPEGYPRGPTR
jgi:hypothetical protein